MNGTLLQVGRFTSTGNSTYVVLPADVDLMYVYNVTQAIAAQTAAVGVKYYWQRGFDSGAKWVTYKSNAAAAANLESYVTTGGFTLTDTSLQAPGILQSTITAVSAAAIPVVTNGGVNGLNAGDTVRLSSIVGGAQLGGIDFTVGNNTLSDTTFSLDYMSQIVAATTGSFRKISFDPIFYPAHRVITKITQAAQAIITLSVTHGYQVGQTVRISVPAACGMVEMNGLLGTIVAIDTDVDTGNTITVDIDSTAFTAFAFPLTAGAPFTPAQVTPVGENTADALVANVNILSDATLNDSFIGMKLQGGVSCPGGAEDDVIYWAAYKAFGVRNLS